MERDYFLSRIMASMEMADKAADASVRLIHLDLAGRYSVAAAVAASLDGSITRDRGPGHIDGPHPKVIEGHRNLNDATRAARNSREIVLINSSRRGAAARP